jgi:hypothetical protein
MQKAKRLLKIGVNKTERLTPSKAKQSIETSIRKSFRDCNGRPLPKTLFTASDRADRLGMRISPDTPSGVLVWLQRGIPVELGRSKKPPARFIAHSVANSPKP